jgi:putative ABC transport system permease protein
MLTHDLRHALRALARRPGLSVAVILILALGIGSTTTIASIASSVLLRKIPYKDSERLVIVRNRTIQDHTEFSASWLDVQSWRERCKTLDLISASSAQQLNLTGEGRAERIGVSFVSTTYFDLLGVRPILGRDFEPLDESRTSPPAVALLTYGLWQRRYGGDPGVVGQSLQLQGLSFQIVGVLPRGFHDLYPDIQLYVPVTISRLTHRPGYVEERIVRWLDVFARLRPGVSLQQAQEELGGISKRLAAAYPATNEGYELSVQPLRNFQFDYEGTRKAITTLFVGALFVLLIGCANVVNLLLVRALERRKEVALRLALGISRFRLIRHFVIEGAVLCLAGAALGVAASVSGVKTLAKLGNDAYGLPAFIQFSLDGRALAVAVVLAVAISLLIGVIPARKSLKVDLQDELKSEGKGHSQSAGTAFTRSFLVVSAIFFSVVLLIGAGLMIKSLRTLVGTDPGYRVDDVLTASFELPATTYTTDAPSYLFYRRLLDRAKTLPGVEAAGVWAPGILGSSLFIKFVVAEGKPLEAPESQVKVYEHRITPHLLQALGIRLLEGRDLGEHDDAGHPLVVVVSRSAAAALWPGRDPIGKRFWVGPPQNVWAEVVGVAADVAMRGQLYPDHDYRLDVYFPLLQMRSRTSAVVLLMRRDTHEARQALSQLTPSIDQDIPSFDIKSMRERRAFEEAGVRFNTLLLIFFAASALVLAIVGIYSILVYTVRQQSLDIGIRMALGANHKDILRHFVARGAELLAVGLIAGLACAFGVARSLSSILFKVSPYDPLVFVAVPLVIALFSLPAILLPASRATQADPSTLFRLN